MLLRHRPRRSGSCRLDCGERSLCLALSLPSLSRSVLRSLSRPSLSLSRFLSRSQSRSCSRRRSLVSLWSLLSLCDDDGDAFLESLRDGGCERDVDPSDDSLRISGTYLRSGREGARLPPPPSSNVSRSLAPMPSNAGREGGSQGSTIPRFLFLLAGSPGFQPIPRSSAAPNCATGTRS